MNKILSLLTICLLFSACHPTGHFVKINKQRFEVELADDEHERAMGLMYREEMGDDEGMLFIFPSERPRAFWMKNTLIPLDILYFDRHKKLVSFSLDTPPCKNTTSRCPSYPSEKPAKYVLEINAGLVKKHKIQIGDIMEIHSP